MALHTPHFAPRVSQAQLVLGPEQTLTPRALIEGLGDEIVLTQGAWDRIEKSFARLQTTIDDQALVYGVTTGFGPLANRVIDPSRAGALQHGLVHHLASGVGEAFPWDMARSILILRLNTLVQGYSGASPILVKTLIAFLNQGLAPYIPQRGTVGASGDLTPLAHCALALMGKGQVLHRDGRVQASLNALAERGLTPLELKDRDGLALVNGVAAMSALGAHNQILAERLTNWSLGLSHVLGEVFESLEESWDPIFYRVRPHNGVGRAIARLGVLGAGGTRLQTRLAQIHVGQRGGEVLAFPAQDAYSLRCVPQLVGACLDALRFHGEHIQTELNSVSDNPVFGEDAPYAYHGGNFFGQHVAMASDTLSLNLIQLANLHERQIARLCDEKKNKGLPAFLSAGEIGVDSGYMGAQVTASAILSEMRAFAPLSYQGVSTNGDNQDVVTMGTSAARKTHALLQDISLLQAIELHALVQALDIQWDQGAQRDAYSPLAHALHDAVRAHWPKLETDRALSEEIEHLATWIRGQALDDLIGDRP